MATGVFGLRKVYIKQNENIDNRNFASWPESAVYGYFIGGSIPPSLVSSTVNRLEFSTDVVSLPGKNLPTAAPLDGGFYNMDSFSNPNSSYGYLTGGNLGLPTSCVIRRLDFSNETLSLPGKNLPTVRVASKGTNNNSYGYVVGGFVAPVYVSSIVRLDFSNETISLPGKNLPVARGDHASVYDKLGIYAYFGGGYAPTSSCTITRLEFSSETASLPGKNLNTNRAVFSGTSSVSYGYFAGGDGFPQALNTISRLDFSTENVSNPGNNLPSGLRATSNFGASSNYFGYFGGGYTPTITCNICRLDFSTEIASLIPIGLNQSRGRMGALTGGQSIYRGSKTYGYIGGGVSPPPFTYFSEVRSIDFSNDSNTPIGSFSTVGLIPGGRWGQATLSSNYYGYFCGGKMPPGWSPGYFNTVTRIDFSNNTATDPGRNFITDFRYAAGSSSNSYGFIVGGFRGVTMCSIQRMDFSSETFASTGQPNVFFTGNQASVSNSSYGYHVDSGTTYRLDFSTSGLSLPGNNTNLQVRTNIAGFSDNRYGYFGGGYSPTSPGTYTSQMARLDFSTESYSSSTNLPVATSLHAGTSSNTHGYFIAGANPPGVTRTTAVNKLDFGTEIFSPTTAISSARSELSAMSNSN